MLDRRQSMLNIDSVAVNVLTLPIADAGPDLWICPGGSIQLNTGGLGYVIRFYPKRWYTSDASPAEMYVVTVTVQMIHS